LKMRACQQPKKSESTLFNRTYWFLVMTSIALPQPVRRRGIHIVGGPGSGKSRLMGRAIAFHDFISKVPVLVIDPRGATIDNFIDKFTYLDRETQRSLVKRIIYVDMSGRSGYVPGFPLYYRLHGDTLRDVAFRFLDITRKLDPSLTVAPVRGWNAIKTIGTNVGMVLGGLGEPISEAPSLLSETAAWIPRLAQLPREANPAKVYFTHRYQSSKREQERAESFLPEIVQFTHDEVWRTMFCAKEHSIDWESVVKEKKIVLMDYRYEIDPRFKMLWAFTNFIEYVKMRGMDRNDGISVIVDELSFLLALNSSGDDLLSADMDDLINNVSRNCNLWLTLAHQEMHQLPEMIRLNLMGLGTQIIGRTSNDRTALDYARRFTRYDPEWIKRSEPIFNRDMVAANRNIEFSHQEQHLIKSYEFMGLSDFEFLAAVTYTEGGSFSPLQQLSIAGLDSGQYVNSKLVDRIKELLAAESGLAVAPEPEAQALEEGFKVPARSGTNRRTSKPPEAAPE